MTTTISIDTNSFQRNPSGGARRLSVTEISTLANACARLLEELGDLRNQVEVIKISSWHAYGHPNIFDVKTVLSMHGEGPVKIEAQGTFEHRGWHGSPIPDWDLDELSIKIVNEMKRKIYRGIESRIFDLNQMRGRWEKFAPIDIET